jgi:hypothetical protein
MSERLRFQGRLLEKEQEAKSLELRIQGLRDSIREILDPFEKISEINTPVAFEQMTELVDLHLRYSQALAEIKAIRKALGR